MLRKANASAHALFLVTLSSGAGQLEQIWYDFHIWQGCVVELKRGGMQNFVNVQEYFLACSQ